MAVNGIEIEVGQVWITYAEAIVTIEHLLDGGKFLGVDQGGDTRVYDINGRSDTTGGYLASDLERLSGTLHVVNAGDTILVKREVTVAEPEPELNVQFAGTTEADADSLASEMLSALGFVFDGQGWVKDEATDWPTAKKSALDIQHGGDHYKGFAIQPVEFIHANGVPFIEGNCIKYLMRWREKGGVKDLDKVKHYVDLLIELEAKHTKVF